MVFVIYIVIFLFIVEQMKLRHSKHITLPGKYRLHKITRPFSRCDVPIKQQNFIVIRSRPIKFLQNKFFIYFISLYKLIT